MLFFSYVFVILLGLTIGSFLGAYSYRLPKNISILFGRSKCVKCHRDVLWFDNIPLLSYVFLSGKCRFCKETISPRYFFIELATSILFLFIYIYCLSNNLSLLSLVYYLFFCSVLILIFVIDFENQIIPDHLVFLLVALSVFANIFFYNNFYNFMLAGFGTSLLLLLLNLITRGKGMGLGDCKLSLVLGFFLGPVLSLVYIFLSFILGSVWGVVMLIFGRISLGVRIAFAPYLITAFFITWFFGNRILILLMQDIF